jgi:uncharacterized membrane protein
MDTKKAKSRMAKLRYPLQSTALIIALLAPFALYWALSLGNPPLAVVFFILMVLSLALTAFAG